MTTNADLFAAAQAVIPGGVDSPVRAYGSVGGCRLSWLARRVRACGMRKVTSLLI